MREIEEIARLIGEDSPIVRKERLRLNYGLSSPGYSLNLLGRLLKKKRGIDINDMASCPPPDHDIVGLGQVPFARDWETGEKRICFVRTPSNAMLLGMAGTGKTSLLRLLAHEFITLGISQVKVIDFLGNFSMLERCCQETPYLDTPGINIMQSNGVPGQRWFNVLFDQVAFHSDTMIGGRSFLNRANHELIRKFEGTGEVFCLQDVAVYMQWLLRKKMLNLTDRGYCERIVGKLLSWDAESGAAFACQRGALDVLDSCNQIIALRALSEELQRFYVSCLLARDFSQRLFNPELSQRPLVYIIDEVKHLFPSKDERPGVKSAILSMLTQTRNVNMYWIVATQEPSKLAHTCLANAQTKIILGISEGLDLSVVQQSLRLNADQVKEIARFVEPGQAMIKLARHPEPFLGKIDVFTENGSEEAAESNRRLVKEAEDSVIPRSGYLERILYSGEREQDSKYGKISRSAKRLLEAYGRESHKSLTELYEASGLGTKGSKAKKELCIAGFIKERDIPVKNRRGTARYLLNITDRGKSWLMDSGIRPHIKGKGGPKELYYSVAVEEWAVQKGFSVFREYMGADLVLVSKEREKITEKIAVEIACRKDNQVNNIRRDLETGLFQKIAVACETDRIMNDVKDEYMSSGIEPGNCKVTFLVVNEIML